MHRLELNFNDSSKVEGCLEELRKVFEKTFRAQVREASPRQMLTMPEYLEVKKQAVLEFDSRDDLNAFMRSATCRAVYQKYAC